MSFNPNDLLPDELKGDYAYKVDDFLEVPEIYTISSITQIEYFNKPTLALTLNDSPKLLPLNTNAKLKALVGILGDDLNQWCGKNVGIIVKSFYDRDKDKTVRYLSFDLPQETFPEMREPKQKMRASQFFDQKDISPNIEVNNAAAGFDDYGDEIDSLITGINTAKKVEPPNDDDIPFGLIIAFIGLSFYLAMFAPVVG